MDHELKAVQLTADGFATQKRARFRQLLVFHPLSSDSEFKFYDLDTAPVGGEPYYTFAVYGKGTDNIPFPAPGILFERGIYVTVPAGCTATVIYEEV